MGVIDSITGGVTSVIGDVMGFVDDLISFLTCGGMAETSVPRSMSGVSRVDLVVRVVRVTSLP